MHITQQVARPVTHFDPRFVTKTMHAYLDYPVAASLIALPFVLGLGGSNPSAKWLAVVTGVAAIILTFFTNHKTGRDPDHPVLTTCRG